MTVLSTHPSLRFTPCKNIIFKVSIPRAVHKSYISVDLLSASIDVTMIDIRNFPEQVEHLYTIVDDATSLHQITDESIDTNKKSP